MSSPHHVLRVAVLAAVSLALSFPPAAHAERAAIADAAGDVQKLDWERSTSDDPRFLPAPDETSVDVVRTVVSHRAARVAVTVRFRELARLTEHETFVHLITPAGTQFEVVAAARRGGRVKTALTRNDRAFDCRELRAVLDVQANRVRVLLPTACLDNPRWVRVGITAFGLEYTPTEADPYDFELYEDDGNSETFDPRTSPMMGPKVRSD